MIKQDNLKISDRKHVLFERWLRKYPSASWDEVVLALEAIDENHLAHSVQTNRKQWVRFNITCIYMYIHVLCTNLYIFTITLLGNTSFSW